LRPPAINHVSADQSAAGSGFVPAVGGVTLAEY
jgi:hypothetical protein